MKMTNLHNLIAYRRWAPIYDATVNHIFTFTGTSGNSDQQKINPL
jgi:hypothetical protein